MRCAMHSCPKNWSKWLFLAEYWYNTTFHSSLGRTPFEVIYGHLPREFAVTQVEESSVPDLAAWLQERAVMMDHLQQQLKHAQDRMKKQADKHHTDRSFEVGDLVYLKLQPFIQTSVAQRPYQKLAFRYYGPYPIIARIGKVAYKLQREEGRLVRDRPPYEPTGLGSPPSGSSWTGRARRLRAVPTARRGSMAPSDRGDVMGSVATVSRRARDGRPVRCTVATPVSGFGGDRRYCSHTPSHRR